MTGRVIQRLETLERRSGRHERRWRFWSERGCGPSACMSFLTSSRMNCSRFTGRPRPPGAVP
jgi:hypothetical protein